VQNSGSNYDEDFEIYQVRTDKCCIIKVLDQKKIGNRHKIKLEITPPAIGGKERFFTDTFTVTMPKKERYERIGIGCRGFYLKNQQ